jgi:hypothetical protein
MRTTPLNQTERLALAQRLKQARGDQPIRSRTDTGWLSQGRAVCELKPRFGFVAIAMRSDRFWYGAGTKSKTRGPRRGPNL